ncbi:MAG: hypothetical protein ABJB86_09420 [Bacteroidota bacterium]
MSDRMTGIGKDALPGNIAQSAVFSDDNIFLLASVTEIPVIDPAYYDEKLKNIFQYYSINPDELEKEIHFYAKELLDMGNVAEAWQVLLSVTQ